jgi:arylsulfatase
MCELAGINVPDNTDGISFLPELKGQKQIVHNYLYWEFPETGGQQAVRQGKW